MTHRCPFQPLPFLDFVILRNTMSQAEHMIYEILKLIRILLFPLVLYLSLEIQSKSFVKESCALICFFQAPCIFRTLHYSVTEEFSDSYNIIGMIAFVSQRTELLSFSLLVPLEKKIILEKSTNSEENESVVS